MGREVGTDGHGRDGRLVYVLNSGKINSDITEGNASEDYDTARNNTTKAYSKTSVNPTIVINNLKYENSVAHSHSSGGDDLVNSAMFGEIRKTSHSGSVSNDSHTTLGNRILPTDKTLTTYCTNKQDTSSYRIKIYDNVLSASVTNRRLVYANAVSEQTALDIDNYDYFVLINPEIVTIGNDTVRPHFAKITQITTFDLIGDGFEFEPKYPSEIPKGTNFEIYKGPAKTDVDIVAVSYGLRGDTLASSPKYDRTQVVSLPTWYFYNNKLDKKNQLDYMTKYTLTSMRWWDFPTSNATTYDIVGNDAHAQYELGSIGANTGKRIQISSSGDNNITSTFDLLTEGMSVFALWHGSGGSVVSTYIGNIQSMYKSSNDAWISLDYARVQLNANQLTAIIIGKTIQNIVFRTEPKYGNTINNIGKFKLNAVLVDANKTLDDADIGDDLDPVKWNTAFPRMHRHTGNLLTATANTIDGNLTGASKYITFEKAEYHNNRISQIRNIELNNPKHRLSKLLKLETIDTSGTHYLTIKNGKSIYVDNTVFSGSLNGYISVKGNVFRNTNTSTFTIKDINKEFDLRQVLSVNDIVLIGNYYYVINVVSAQSSGTQSFTIKDKKLNSANTWTGSAVAENVDNKTLYLSPYTGVLNTEFSANTEFNYTTSKLSVEGNRINKENVLLHKANLKILKFNSHVNKIDYGDKNNNFLKIIDSDRVFYQGTNVSKDRFYYYRGGYALNVNMFNGFIDDTSTTSENGLPVTSIVARDKTTKLLGTNINRNLTFSNDIVYSTLTPLLPNAVAISGLTSLATPVTTGKTLTWSSGTPNPVPVKYGIILNQVGELLGEVNSYTSTTITLFDNVYTTPTTTTSLKYYHPYSSTSVNYLSASKALRNNPLQVSSTNSFNSIVDKGLVFQKGLSLNLEAGSSINYSYADLINTSNTGNYINDGTLGYDISNPKGIDMVNNSDNRFIITLGNENGAETTFNDISTVNSENFEVVSLLESDGISSLEIAPTFPVVLGRLDVNTSDTRGNCKIYMVNNNIPTGGFIHRLQDNNIVNFGPKETIRYWDLQKFNEGQLTKTFDSIYNEGEKSQKIQGYAVGYVISTGGTIITPTLTDITRIGDCKPISGSNTLLGWTYKNSFYGTAPLIQSYVVNNDAGAIEVDIKYDAFEQIDPRTDTYEFFATGDVFPNSKIRHNHIGNSNHDNYHFENYGLILENKTTLSGSTSHSAYTGTSSSSLETADNFEEVGIKKANKKPSEIRRWGIVRLVEATFDWHFNPVDFDSLKPVREIPTIPYFDYVTFPAPSIDQDSKIVTGGNAVLTGLTTPSTGAYVDIYNTVQIGTSPFIEYLPSLYPTGANFVTNGFMARYLNGTLINNLTLLSTTNTFGSTSDNTNNLLSFTGNSEVLPVEKFRIFTSRDNQIEQLLGREVNTGVSIDGDYLPVILTTKFHQIVDSESTNINFTNIYLLKPNIHSTYFKYGLLKDDDNASDVFHPHNIIIPIISEVKSATSAVRRNQKFSALHQPRSWATTNNANRNIDYLHMSRVMAGLMDRDFSDSQTNYNWNLKTKLGVGISSPSNATVSHIYDNCIGVFKNVEGAGIGTGTVQLHVTSSPLGLDTDSNYSDYLTGDENGQDQHSRNLMIQVYDTDGVGTNQPEHISMTGTKSEEYFLSNDGDGLTDTKFNTHSAVDATTGSAHTAQMIVKPKFNLTAVTDTLVYSNSNKTITFTLDNDSTHTWLSYMPKLVGYYLVSESTTSGLNLRNNYVDSSPKFIAKILSHRVSTAPSTSYVEKQEIILDTPINLSDNGVHYRLMRISETTFDDTPEIKLNTMQDRGLAYDVVAVNFLTGRKDAKAPKLHFQEAVYSMHLLLDIDNINTHLERRTQVLAGANFTDEETIDCYITDGQNQTKKTLTVNKTSKAFTFNYAGNLKGNGVVSFGEIFTTTIDKKPTLSNPTKCTIGTTFALGKNIDNEVETIVKESGLDFNYSSSFLISTGNIVNTQNSTTIVCLNAVKNISLGETLYSHNGHIIGKVSGVSGSTITFSKKYYTPLQYDELVTYNKKTHISTLKFENTNAFDALNSLMSKKGLDFKIKNNLFTARNIDDKSLLGKYSVGWQNENALIKINSNESLFDKADKVIVIGDRVQFEMDIISDESNSTFSLDESSEKVITEIDVTIRTINEARIKALEISNLHTDNVKKIELIVDKKGLELLEAGDYVELNFPTHGIPKADYMVFEIKNVIAGTLSLVVGTFNKTIAERLAKLSSTQKNTSSLLLTKGGAKVISGKLLKSSLNINVVSVEYEINGLSNSLSYNSNMGFDDQLGFGTDKLGFRHSTVTKKDFKQRLYDGEEEI